MRETRKADFIHAQQAVEQFWGLGPIGSAEDLLNELLPFNLNKTQYKQLRDELPMARGNGTTGQRVETANRLLEKLAQ